MNTPQTDTPKNTFVKVVTPGGATSYINTAHIVSVVDALSKTPGAEGRVFFLHLSGGQKVYVDAENFKAIKSSLGLS